MAVTIPGTRPCTIREDGHQAIATHQVASDAYGFVAGAPRARLFCGECAGEEKDLLEEFGFSAALDIIVHPVRVFPPVDPQPSIIAWAGDDPIWGTV